MRGLKDRHKLTSVRVLVKYTSLLFDGHQGIVPEGPLGHIQKLLSVSVNLERRIVQCR